MMRILFFLACCIATTAYASKPVFVVEDYKNDKSGYFKAFCTADRTACKCFVFNRHSQEEHTLETHGHTYIEFECPKSTGNAEVKDEVRNNNRKQPSNKPGSD